MTGPRVADGTAAATPTGADPPVVELVGRTSCMLVLTLVAVVQLVAIAAFLPDPGVGVVDPSELSAGVVRGERPVDGLAVGSVLVVATCAMLIAALPGVLRAPHQRRTGLAITGAAVLGWSALVCHLTTAFYFSGQGDGCSYPTCWPLPWQTIALAAPGVLLGLTTIGVAFARRARWWVVAAPALVWVAAVVAQRLLWPGVLLPLFSGPPP